MMLEKFPTPAHGLADGFPLLAALIADEVAEASAPAQARAFYGAIGRRMAALESLNGVTDTHSLAIAVNAFWARLGWGEALFTVAADCIMVRHAGAPLGLPGDAAHVWPDALAAVLEGVYDAWFRALGSGPVLTTRARWDGNVLELRHGR